MTALAISVIRDDIENEWQRTRCRLMLGDWVTAEMWLPSEWSDGKVAQSLFRFTAQKAPL